MMIVLRRMVFLLVVLCVVVPLPDGRAATIDVRPLVSGNLLDEAKLRMDWQVNLPLKKAEKIERMYVFENFLYVLTDNNYLFCIERAKGVVRFDLQLAVAGLPVTEPLYYDGKLWFLVGTELLVLNPRTGAITESKRLATIGKSTVSKPARNQQYLFVAGSNRRLHAINIDNYHHVFAATADNDSHINSVIADERFVVFSTKVGNIVSISSGEAKKYWQRDISGSISAPLVRDDRWLYVSSENKKLYKLDIFTGENAWPAQFQAGYTLVDPVIVGKDVLYQYAGGKGLYAIDKDTGKGLWNVRMGMNLLAETDSLAYVIADPGVLIVMDNAEGKKLYSVNFTAVTKYAVNTTDAIIYVADDKGRLASIAGN